MMLDKHQMASYRSTSLWLQGHYKYCFILIIRGRVELRGQIEMIPSLGAFSL